VFGPVIDAPDIFGQHIGDVRIEDNGFIVEHSKSINSGEVRGKNTYASGKHRLRFRIERKSSMWVYIGVTSKTAPMKQNSYETSSSYGWVSYDHYYAGGVITKRGGIFAGDSNLENDVIELLIDVTNQTLQYTNERTRQTQKLTVNIAKCPLPWQILINLTGSEDRIRILN
jgi:hypothetical protein